MEEKRKSKRLEINVEVKLERIDGDASSDEYVDVKVLDISRTGIGFVTDAQLDIASTYETRMEIWTKETLNVFIKIVRESIGADGERTYGAIFVGMNESDQLKIDIYRIFNEM